MRSAASAKTRVIDVCDRCPGLQMVLDGEGDGVLIRFRPHQDVTLGLPRRAWQITQRVADIIRRAAPVDLADLKDGLDARFATRPSELDALLARIANCVNSFKRERLYPKAVEQILGISALERIRWTKDGRLPRSGTGSFVKGRQKIAFSMHPAGAIATLAADPDIIRRWREDDASLMKDPSVRKAP